MRLKHWQIFMLPYLAAALLVVSAHCQQSGIAPARQAEIKRALHQHGYNGDMTTALKQVAQDHGWQHKVAPDARVIIWLGLGPKYNHLLNPETAWIPSPAAVIAKR